MTSEKITLYYISSSAVGTSRTPGGMHWVINKPACLFGGFSSMFQALGNRRAVVAEIALYL
jgi:hypothetical protein